MSSIFAFPKIFHIGEKWIPDLFKGAVEITEKIDGSQFCFGVDKEGRLVYRSKGEDLTEQRIPKMFEMAVFQVNRIESIIKGLRDIYFYCEFLGRPKHNVLNYGRIPKNNLYLFGVQSNGVFVWGKELTDYAWMIDIEPVNILSYGGISSLEQLDSYLVTDSVLGNEKVEGIVVKNYAFPILIGSQVIPLSMGKYVREEYKERHKSDSDKYKPSDKLQAFIDSFRNEARWQKAVQHLTESDKLEHAPRDIGILIKEIERDLREECFDAIGKWMAEHFSRDIIKRACAGFPEWYKSKLAESAFNVVATPPTGEDK